MDANLKSASIPESRQTSADSDSARRSKIPTFRVQTSIRAGWIPGSNVRDRIRELRFG
jgi:hypothetical protein